MKSNFFSSSRSIVLLAAASAITLIACKKEGPITEVQSPAQSPQASMYNLPLTTGSYWIYQNEQLDSNGILINTGACDSMFVEGDSTIGANVYKKIRTIRGFGNGYFPLTAMTLLRDSAGYHVNPQGEFIEHDNFTDTINNYNVQNTVDVWYFMEHEDSLVTVPAGTFQTIDYKGHAYALVPNYPWPSPRFTHRLFANNIGEVRQQLHYFSSPDYIQRSLLRYHIQ
jgi:hypothetical protein